MVIKMAWEAVGGARTCLIISFDVRVLSMYRVSDTVSHSEDAAVT